MSLRYTLLLLLVLCGLPMSPLQAQAPAPPPPEPLANVIADLRPMGWEEVVDVARASTGGGLLRYPSTKVEEKVYQGDFLANSDQDRLAIFSDDGCRVTISYARGPDIVVLDRKGQGQSLPDFTQSLHRLPMTLRQGVTYHIRIEYSNTSYTGAGDIDGVSLFAYQNRIPLAPVPAPPNPLPLPLPLPPGTSSSNPSNPPAGNPAPPAPTPSVSLQADQVTTTSARLYWSYNGPNLGSYRLFRDITANFTPSNLNALTNDVTVLEYPDSGLHPSTTYYYLLRTRLSDGTVLSDTPFSLTTHDPTLPQATFADAPRLCAGHLFDGLSQGAVSGHITQQADGGAVQPLVQTELKLDFSGNTPSGSASFPPQSDPVPRPAAFVLHNADGSIREEATITVTTDDHGDFSCTLVSSSVVTTQIQVRVRWKDAHDEYQEIGTVALNCAAAEARTAYNLNDGGWHFDPALFGSPGQIMKAQVRLMFCRDPSHRNEAASWAPVGGHQLRVALGEVNNDESNGSPRRTPETLSFVNNDIEGYYIDERGRVIRVPGVVLYPLAPGANIDPATGDPMVPVTDTGRFSVPSSVPTSTNDQGWATVYLKTGPLMPQLTRFNLRVSEVTQRR